MGSCEQNRVEKPAEPAHSPGCGGHERTVELRAPISSWSKGAEAQDAASRGERGQRAAEEAPKGAQPRRQLRDRRPVPRQRPRFVITKRTEVPSFFLAYARLSRASPKADPSEDSQPTQQLEDPATSKRCHNRDARKPSACKGFRKRPSFGRPLA